MSVFTEELVRLNPPAEGRRWIFAPYDQVTDSVGPLSREDPRDVGVILVENPWKAARRPYHKQKLALILSNLRHFALEQAARGVAIRHLVAEGPYRTALEPLTDELGPLRMMRPAERELRDDLQPLVDTGLLTFEPHEGWMTDRDHFVVGAGEEPPWRMDSFYRHVRKKTGLLMDGGKPVGAKFSFDPENRLEWKGEPEAPRPPTFPRDAIKEEVGDLIGSRFAHHPGALDLDRLPATREDAVSLWTWAKRECLPHFGPYEDAMSVDSTGLFHTRLSALLNILRLTPARILDDVLHMDLPLQSKEGFIRQVIGWREFVNHVHAATDGFRDAPEEPPPISEYPGDAGYRTWAGAAWKSMRFDGDPDGGARPNHLDARNPAPVAYWGRRSGLVCLDRTVTDVWRIGYSHHIQRLMVLSNIASLLDVNPRELTDWFWVAYTDAYDWVVEPNVFGMGTYALGDLMITKPYVSGASYINRMSDYCPECSFHPKRDCPITPWYWAFLERHREVLEPNPRMKLPLASLEKRASDRKKRDRKAFERGLELLAAGEALKPTDFV